MHWGSTFFRRCWYLISVCDYPHRIILVNILLRFNICNAECLAFLALADVVDIIMSTARNDVKPEQLLARVYRFLHNFEDAFGYDSFIPKFHWLLHFPKSLRDVGTLVACFVHERKHRMLKRYCNDIRNTTAFEHSVLAEEPLHYCVMCLCGFLFVFSVAFIMRLHI